MKKIDGTWYNVDVISRMSFEEFRSTCTGWTDDKINNIYFQITGKKPETKSKKKATPVTDEGKTE